MRPGVMVGSDCPVRTASCSRRSRLAKPQGSRRNQTRRRHSASTRRSVVRSAEVRCPLTSTGQVQPLHRAFSHRAVVAETFDCEKTSVGRKADVPQRRQVPQPLADVEVAGVVDGRLRAGSDLGHFRKLLEVLLEARVLAIDVERGDHSAGEHPGPKTPRCLLRHTAAKDQLDHVRTADVEILPDDLLGQNAATQRTVQDLGQGELGLQDGQLIAVVGLTIGCRVGMGQPCQPAAQQTVDLCRPHCVADGLQPSRIGTEDQPVVPSLVGDPFLPQLTLGVLVSVQTQFGRSHTAAAARRRSDTSDRCTPAQT
jgi:hypothetical protein